MRLWSLHPRYLDARGLVALWREALLAQAVLRGRTQGYRHHAQLARFRASHTPARALARYLRAVHAESVARGYSFSASKIARGATRDRIEVTRGQLDYEWKHLIAKLAVRDPNRRALLSNTRRPEPHPMFRVVPGGIAPWEKRRRSAKPSFRRSTSRSPRRSTKPR
jgi:hypothetical protein